jgi:2'-5' RNA ligase
MELHQRIQMILLAEGLATERRSFLPHITLGRLQSGGKENLADALNIQLPPLVVTEIMLYESLLSTDGSEYKVIEVYPIAMGC